jgi:hypothetical protein
MPHLSAELDELAPRRRRRSLPVIAGTLIAAAGLVLGGVATASAHNGHSTPDPTPAPNAAPPRNGDAIPNVTTVESQIEAFYGKASATYPVVGAVTVPASNSNYARQLTSIEGQAKRYLASVTNAKAHAHGKPALIFDIDDTTLNTYDYEVANQFGYTPASNATFVTNEAFPAEFGMPALVDWAGTHGYTVFFLTGRPESQRTPTVQNLVNAGYTVPTDQTHVYLKQATPPAYLHCAAAPTCTTIEYKSGTRAYITSLGYHVIADFGDQFSDLKGGNSGVQFKIPNPMYYLP